MRRRIAATALLAAGVMAGQALAQDAGKLSEGDKAFLTKEARGAAYELDIGKMAVKKAARPDVKSYVEKLVHDHEDYNAALEKLGKDQGLTLSTEPDAADKAHLDDLAALDGAAFDTLFVEQAVQVNAEDKKDGAAEKEETKNQAIQAFMQKFSSMDEEHEKLAKALEKKGV